LLLGQRLGEVLVGLAMSSRNVYLNPAQRRRALALFKALTEAKAIVEEFGESDPTMVEEAMRRVLMANDLAVDYAVVRHPRSLASLDMIEPALTGGVVALIAARVDAVRLIDNMLLGGASTPTGEVRQDPSAASHPHA
jgi:pantoate--beta-alanine ligase